MLLPFAERIFVINLPERTDRRIELRRQFKEAGWNPDDPSITYFDAVKPEAPGPFPSIGAHGCFMSHLGVLNRAVDDNVAALAILEDDLDFVPGFDGQVKRVAAELEKTDWKIFYGGYETKTPPAPEGPITAAGPNIGLRTTHFICFRGDAIKTARDYLTAMRARQPGDPAGGPMHVDGAYQWFRGAHPELQCYMATPEIGVQRSSKSDIAPLRWFDRTPVIASAVAALRRIRKSVN